MDYGHDLKFGVFITPANSPVMHAVELAVIAENAGLDLATFQDHPYQPRFHDTWTLLSFVAARTERIHLSANVHNLPLRHPALLARSAASLDLLSGGRLELGLGAGGFWDAIVAMGGTRKTPGESIEALEEGIRIIRDVWDTGQPGGVHFEGKHYSLIGAKHGPSPAHDIGISVGAYKPRILRMTGRVADGWLPSLGYLQHGLAELADMNARIDEGADAAGRDPRAIRRMLNIGGQFAPTSSGLLQGPPAQWVRDLTGIALEYGISGFILASDDAATIELYASEVAPAVREAVSKERG